MAAIFGPGGPIMPWAVQGDRFRGGTVHGVTGVVIIVFLPLKLVQTFLLRLNHDHPGLIMGYQLFYASPGGGY